MSTDRPARDRGFTLLEVLVAFTLLALVMGAAYATMGSGLQATTRSDRALTALGLAESALARIGTERPLEIGSWREETGDWSTEVTITGFGGNTLAWNSVGQRPLEITVEVRAAGDRGASARLTSLRLGRAAR